MEPTIFRTGGKWLWKDSLSSCGKRLGSEAVPRESQRHGIMATRWAYNSDLSHRPLACVWAARRMKWEGASALQVHAWFRLVPLLSLPLSSSASPNWSHWQEPPADLSCSAANSDQGRKWMWSLSLTGGRRGWNSFSCFQSAMIVPRLSLRGDGATTTQSW